MKRKNILRVIGLVSATASFPFTTKGWVVPRWEYAVLIALAVACFIGSKLVKEKT